MLKLMTEYLPQARKGITLQKSANFIQNPSGVLEESIGGRAYFRKIKR